jgi:hypothetical protein
LEFIRITVEQIKAVNKLTDLMQARTVSIRYADPMEQDVLEARIEGTLFRIEPNGKTLKHEWKEVEGL